MQWWHALFLGVLQGITEFLPVSSSGHLVIAQTVFGFKESLILFDVLLHAATLTAVVLFFFQRWTKLRLQDLGPLVVGTLPIVVVGLAAKDQIEALFKQPSLVAGALVMTGFFNVMIQWRLSYGAQGRSLARPKYGSALIMGFFQALAVIPGISRSGSTINGGLQVGLSREKAFEWSFLLALPAILGATVLQLRDVVFAGVWAAPPVGLLLIGVVAAFVSGLLSLKILEWVMASAKMWWFAVYCWFAAVSFLMWLPQRQSAQLARPLQAQAEVTVVAGSSESDLSDEPKYVVVNIADFYFADWTANEASWSAQVKPELLETLDELKTELGTGSAERRLAWSTLLEYTDFPLDQPTADSPYMMRVERILDLAEAAELPVYLPLNGYQWWNEVPELWNHWDFDGNQTPGCANDEFELIDGFDGTEPIYRCNMSELRDPTFRVRFIAGYDPANKWNVEWQDWQTPMQLNWRNWGAGGFRLAPPPNLVDHGRTDQTYRSFQGQRYQAIIEAIADRWQTWQAQGRSDLLVGISIGTEVSLNASVTPEDEFEPYGYRGMSDLTCGLDQEFCPEVAELDPEQLDLGRQEVVRQYLDDLSRAAVRAGLPKSKVYTHVWSEAEPGEARYANYLAAAHTFYARPGLSLYGKSENPHDFQLLQNFLRQNDYPIWAAPEYSAHGYDWDQSLSNTFKPGSTEAALVDVYNWREHKDTLMPGAVRRFFSAEAQAESETSCLILEPQLLTDMAAVDPSQLSWQFKADDLAEAQTIAFFSHDRPYPGLEPDFEYELSPTATSYQPSEIPPGAYYWAVSRSGCNPEVRRWSALRTVVFSHSVPEPSWLMKPIFWFDDLRN